MKAVNIHLPAKIQQITGMYLLGDYIFRKVFYTVFYTQEKSELHVYSHIDCSMCTVCCSV
jgi:hypothetical protein